MADSSEQIKEWLTAKEDEHLEVKEAKNSFEFEDLVKYCAALANEGGGHMILGATDRPPRRVVGSQAFGDLERTKAGLVERLHLRIEAAEFHHPGGRVVVFTVPSRPLGVPIQYRGAYWMRAGQDLVPMTSDTLRRIFEETGPDFSAEIRSKASIDDLDSGAIERFRTLWRRKSGIETLDRVSVRQLLADAELLIDGQITYAALILLGTREALGKYLGQAEVVFEYRSSEASGPAQHRVEYRTAAISFLEDIWNTISLRNDIQHFQDGLFIWDIPTFSEAATREAILNAVAHRDYRRVESVFIRQYPRRLEIVSPGGFLPGITPENFLWKQAPRNRRIAEAFAKCGLVERAGQGANRMLEECIKESKPLPDLSGTDEYQVALALRGEVQEPGFLRFLEKIGRERLAEFTTMDLLVIDLVHREQAVPEVLLYAQTRPGPRDKQGPAPETHRRQSRRWKPTGRVDASPSVAVTKADSIAPRDPQNRGKSAPCWTYYQQSLVPGPATVSSSDARLSASWMMHYNSTRCNRIQSVLGLLPKQGVDLGCTAITGCN